MSKQLYTYAKLSALLALLFATGCQTVKFDSEPERSETVNLIIREW